MILSDVSKVLDRTMLLAKDCDSEMLMSLLNEMMFQVLLQISTGRCQDYPPEDYAQEAIRVIRLSLDELEGCLRNP
jgi:hypothetical protein